MSKGLKETILKMANELVPDIMEANAKVIACPKHSFGVLPPLHVIAAQPFITCVNCGGQLDVSKAIAYAEGYKAAGGDINDVLIGYES